YLEILDMQPDRASHEEYTQAVEEIFDQLVRRVPKLRGQQKWIVRALESLIVGDNARAGVMHRWMYDRRSLEHLLRETGFVEIQTHSESTSQIEGWETFRLDMEPGGKAYKPRSLY